MVFFDLQSCTFILLSYTFNIIKHICIALQYLIKIQLSGTFIHVSACPDTQLHVDF